MAKWGLSTNSSFFSLFLSKIAVVECEGILELVGPKQEFYFLEFVQLSSSNPLKVTKFIWLQGGLMTKDLAILIGPSNKYMTTNQFLDELDGRLKKDLN